MAKKLNELHDLDAEIKSRMSWSEALMRSKREILLKTLSPTETLLDSFVSQAILREHDKEFIKNLPKKSEQLEFLLDILCSKHEAYDEILASFSQNGQHEALEELTPKWTNFDTSFISNYIKRHTIRFQENVIVFGELLQHIPEDQLGPKLHPDFLLDLLKDKTPKLFQDCIPHLPDYYLKRRVTRNVGVSPQILQVKTKDSFAIFGIERYELTRLANGKPTIRSNSVNSVSEGSIILLNSETEFEHLAKLSKSPIHLLKYNGTIFQWVKSKGSLTTVREYIVPNDEEHFDEFNYLERLLQSKTPNCIVDTPGMGKSLFMARLAKKLQEKEKSIFVVYVDFQSFIHHCKRMTCDEKWNNVQKLVRQVLSNSEAEQFIIDYKIQTKSAFLFLDGYDQVQPKDSEVAQRLLENLIKIFSNQVLVTSRPHLKLQLENKLLSFSYHCVPFDNLEQEEFLLEYWRSQYGLQRSPEVEVRARNCLTHLKSSKVINFQKDERDIAGIPLQLRMLARIFVQNDDNQAKVPEGLQNLTEMYSTFVSSCFDQCGLSNGIKAQLISAHNYYATQLLFPSECATLLPQFDLSSLLKSNVIYSIGILEKSNTGEPTFIHRTFAEFFVAEMFVDLIQTKNVPEFAFWVLLIFDTKPAFNNVFNFPLVFEVKCAEFLHPGICYFVDNLLQAKNFYGGPSLCQIEAHERLAIYSASLRHDFPEIGEFVMSQQIDTIESDCQCFPWSNLSLIAAKYSSDNFLNRFIKILPLPLISLKFPTGQLDDIGGLSITPLTVAAQIGRFRGVKHLLEFGFWNLIDEGHPSILTLVHFIVRGSAADKPETIFGKCEILKQLCRPENSANLLNQTLGRLSPLLQSQVHASLLKLLVAEGADVNYELSCSRHENVLRNLLQVRSPGFPPVTPREFHEVAESLAEAGYRNFDGVNYAQKTLLQIAVETLELLPKTVDIFVGSGAKLCRQSEDDRGDTVLHHAVRHLRSLDLILKLVEAGAVVRRLNKKGESILHVGAQVGYLKIVQHFLTNSTLKTERDLQRNTVLHAAMTSNSGAHQEIQKLLIRTWLNVSARNRDDLNPLLFGCQKGAGVTLNILQEMESHGLHITPSMATTALEGILRLLASEKVEWDTETKSVVEHLLKEGGALVDINIPPKVFPDLRRFNVILEEDSFCKFLVQPKGLQAFLDSPRFRCLILLSEDTETSTQRLRDTVEGVRLLPKALLDTTRDRFGVAVVTFLLTSVRQRFTKQKFIFLLESPGTENNIQVDNDTQILRDVLEWTDLTPKFQGILQKFIWECFGEVSTLLFSDHLSNLSSSKLTTVIQSHRERIPRICDAISQRSYLIPFKISPKIGISPILFDHCQIDALLFRGLRFDELQKLARLQTPVTRSSDIRDNFGGPYVLLENDSDFDRICKLVNPNKSAHLIDFKNGRMTLLKSSGSIRNITQFLELSDSIPQEKYFILQNSSVVSLIHFPNSGAKLHFLEALLESHPTDFLVTLRSPEFLNDLNYVQGHSLSGDTSLKTILVSEPLQRELLSIFLLEPRHRLNIIIEVCFVSHKTSCLKMLIF